MLSLEPWLMRSGVVVVLAFLIVAVALPLLVLLSKSMQAADGRFIGLANYARYFATPELASSLWNSLKVSLSATAIVVPLAFGYAYALTRTAMPGKPVFQAIALLPLFAPSLMSAISLIYIFGNQGFLKSWLLGGSIYGPAGIVLAQVLHCFPPAVMILATALSLADRRLYEAAEVLGTPGWRVFTTITLPGAAYGLVSTAFVVFTLVITDFGVAKVIGGQYNVLATDAYKQVVGQQNFEMGAVVGLVLLVPAVLSFAADRFIQRRQSARLGPSAVALSPKPHALLDRAATFYCVVIAGLVLGVMGTAVWASFVTYWPYNLALSTKWYDFAAFEPAGWAPYVASLQMAAIAAVVGTGIIFFGAYLIEKGQGLPRLRLLAQLLAMLPMAVPGLVLGLGYVFLVNARWSPLSLISGTVLLLALNTIAHFYTTAHITAMTRLKQINPEIEAVSASLQVPFWATLARVTVPISLPAILDMAVYLFVNGLTTVSAVIFLYGPDSKLAAISIVHMEEGGMIAAAAAMATLILATAMGARLVHILLDRCVLGRFQAWRAAT